MSPEHFTRLRAIVADAGSLSATYPILQTSPDLVHNALTGGLFVARTIDRLEAKIDVLHRALEERERERGQGAA